MTTPRSERGRQLQQHQDTALALLPFALTGLVITFVNVRTAADRRLLIAAAAVLSFLLEIRQQTNPTMLMRTGY